MLANRRFRPGAWFDHISEAPVHDRRTNLPPFIREICRETQPAPVLFGWSGAGIVLFGERADDRWIVARAWRRGDALTDVRRWSFAAPALSVR
ncbi:MAG TPA: hypothetical protein VFI22_11970, partial [Thermomicrobiales bacterium]|nr:hypothetical protein [Thermomicrobiales bacterium]